MTTKAARGLENLEKLSSLSQSKMFLGREFLTWLWFQAESKADRFKLPGGEKGHYWVDDRVVLESPQSKAHVNSLRGGIPSESAEAAAALETGKTVREMKIGWDIAGVGAFSAVLRASDLSPHALKLPSAVVGDADSELQNRVRLMRLALDVIDTLYATFLAERIADGWENKRVQDIRGWIRGRRKDRGDTLH